MPKVLFHHLAKTAGTSLITNLERVFDGHVCSARYDHEMAEDVMRDDGLRFYHGHYSFRAVRRFRELNPDAFIFTFVRHPFNRVLSQYYNWIDRDRVLRELDVIDARSGSSQLVDDRRTKFEQLIFDTSLDEFLISDDEDIREVTFNHQAGYTSDDTEEDVTRRLGSAIGNVLSFYDFVGIVELYEDCLRILERKLELDVGATGGAFRTNTNDHVKRAGRYCVTEGQFASLVAQNGYDMALHSAAFARLVKDYSSHLSQDSSRYADLLSSPMISAE